jgi:predicted lipid-binding transport protein (Tim44 family)
MYCSSCGGAVSRALTYCNHCGAKLGGNEDDESAHEGGKYRELLVCAMVGGMAVGLGCIIGLMAVMKEVAHFELGLIIAFTLLSFFLLFAIETVLISQLLREQRRSRNEATGSRALPQTNTKELQSPNARALPDPIPSVTEHTTRAFEPVLRERNAK